VSPGAYVSARWKSASCGFGWADASVMRIVAMRPSGEVEAFAGAMPGHQTFHPYPHDLKKARELMAAADPSERDVTVWTDDYAPNRQAGEYYESVLREIGLKPTLKVMPAANYTTIIGNESTPDLDTGWAAWYLDYPHPNDYFQPQLSGEASQ